MATLLNSGIEQCGLSSGIIKRLYIGNYVNLRGAIRVVDGLVSDIDEVISWYEFDVLRGAAELNETVEDTDNGARWLQQLSYGIKTARADVQMTVSKFSKGRFLILAQDGNGKWWLIGANRGAELKNSVTKVGANENVYQTVFLANDYKPMYEVSNDYFIDKIAFGGCSESGIYTDDVTTLAIEMYKILNCEVFP